jgi:hypothetical protein
MAKKKAIIDQMIEKYSRKIEIRAVKVTPYALQFEFISLSHRFAQPPFIAFALTLITSTKSVNVRQVSLRFRLN